ncbi:MAG: SRPBCC family protein [Deltaproteobacteria bacterium]|nr:SRPBCC family protein [Deltaproteobacteria bacterium]
MARSLLACVFLLALSIPARADNLTTLLEKGAMARVDVDKAGKFDAVVSVVDVEVPASRLWAVLNDYESYRFFMPRVASVTSSPGPAATILVKWNIDTPLVTTRYTNSVTVDAAKMLMKARTIEGDMVGSHYDWTIIPLGDNKCRMFHTAWPRNMNGIVDTLDDEHQSLSIGVAVSSVMATIRALKGRAELLEKNAKKANVVVAP